jgi:hypothetical protein
MNICCTTSYVPPKTQIDLMFYETKIGAWTHILCSETKFKTLEDSNNKTTTIYVVEGTFLCRRTRILHKSTHSEFVFKTKKFGRVQMKWACRTSFRPNEKWRERHITATGLATNSACDSVKKFCLEVFFLQHKTRITNMTYNCILLSWNKYTLLQNNYKGLCDTSYFLGFRKTTNG